MQFLTVGFYEQPPENQSSLQRKFNMMRQSVQSLTELQSPSSNDDDNAEERDSPEEVLKRPNNQVSRYCASPDYGG